MAIDLQKINVKLYLSDDTPLSPESAFRAFSRWIPETKDEVLIDVADYAHVPRGPKTVLVGHEANYILDDTDGRPGLRYSRKRPCEGDNVARLRAAFVAALRACRRLEENADPAPRFSGSEALIIVNERLGIANDDATLAAIRGDLDTVLGDVFDGAEADVERLGDAGERLTLRVRVAGDRGVADLLTHLGT